MPDDRLDLPARRRAVLMVDDDDVPGDELAQLETWLDARIAAIRAVLSGIDYAGKNDSVACAPDPGIAGGLEIWNA